MRDAAEAAFAEYVGARWQHLVRFAVLLGADVHAAEDATQTALARCYFSWQRVQRSQNPDAYVHKVLVNTWNESRRRRTSSERPTSTLPEQASADPTIAVDEHRSLLAALKALPEKQRAVLVLRYYADLTEAQTAEVLGVAVGTVKSRAARGIAALANDTQLRPAEGDAR